MKRWFIASVLIGTTMIQANVSVPDRMKVDGNKTVVTKVEAANDMVAIETEEEVKERMWYEEKKNRHGTVDKMVSQMLKDRRVVKQELTKAKKSVAFLKKCMERPSQCERERALKLIDKRIMVYKKAGLMDDVQMYESMREKLMRGVRDESN